MNYPRVRYVSGFAYAAMPMTPIQVYSVSRNT